MNITKYDVFLKVSTKKEANDVLTLLNIYNQKIDEDKISFKDDSCFNCFICFRGDSEWGLDYKPSSSDRIEVDLIRLNKILKEESKP